MGFEHFTRAAEKALGNYLSVLLPAPCHTHPLLLYQALGPGQDFEEVVGRP